ncbi:MAG: TIGR02147 family protein [Bdellovibrionales bacterium]
MELKGLQNRLQKDLDKRIAKNPSYSLRSFAQFLEISPATLSGVLNGKRKPSLEMALKISEALDWKVLDRGKLESVFPSSKVDFHELSDDLFEAISEWQHFAILELLKLPDFSSDPKWISKKLGLNINRVKAALDRLLRLEILMITTAGNLVDNLKGFTTHYNSKATSAPKKLYQKQLLKKSLLSIDEINYELRDHSSMTMAIDSKDIPLLKEEIKKFRLSLCEKFEKKKPDSVYQIQVSLFPLTK